MSKPQPGAHLAPEDMAAMIDGKLASDERAAVVQHLAECEVCREAMAEHARASSALDQGTGRFGGTAAMVWMSVAATLAMATVAGVLVLRRPPAAIDQPAIDGAPAQPPVVSPAPPPLPAASAAAGDHARFAGGLDHPPQRHPGDQRQNLSAGGR